MAEFWDARAARYNSGASGAWHASIAQALVDAVAPRAAERVLDVGCGTGLCALAAARRGALVTGVDLSPEMVAAASGNAREASLSAAFCVGDAQELAGFAPASFDVLTAAAVVPYLPDPPAALQRWRAVLRSGGRAAFHGFHSASIFGDLAVHAAAAVGVPLDFERWTGSAEACAALLRDAGYKDVAVTSLPITDSHSLDEAKAALVRMMDNPLCAPLADALRADAALLPRLRTEYDRLVDSAAASDGRLHTAGQCFIAIGVA